MAVGRGKLLERAKLAGRLAVPAGVEEALEARKLFRARGYEVTLKTALEASRMRVSLLPPEIDLRHGLVVDVGANEGAFSGAVLAVAPDAEIIAAEPAPAPRARMQRRIGSLPNVEIFDVAVSGASGTASFQLTVHDHNSSLQSPRAEMQTRFDPGWAPAGEIEVRTVTLDELVGNRTADVLKIDVQGSEMDVLQGGEATLSRARSVLLEMNFISQYEGDATFNTLHAEMDRLGFSLISVSPALTAPDGTAIFIDGCYAHRSG